MTGQSGYLPYRGAFGSARPAALAALPLPPAPMPPRLGCRPLKAWRYVGVYGPELMLCVASVRIGPARQAFWAVWDRASRRLYERTTPGRGSVALAFGAVRVRDRDVQIELALEEQPGIETVCRSGEHHAWTRKQGGVPARGRVALAGDPRPIEARAVIDDTAAYYERHTQWRWSAGVGTLSDGRAAAWNLVSGVNDPPRGSERTVWIEGVAREAPPVEFAADLSALEPVAGLSALEPAADLSALEPAAGPSTGGSLRFQAEAVRERRENRLLIRSSYRQPFGTFSGALPDGSRLASGYGVMEEHDVWW